MKMIQIVMKVITSKKKDVVPLKRKRGVLKKRMRVLMIEMLMSHKSFMRYSVVFLFPLMRKIFWESGLQGYMKQKGVKDYPLVN